MQIRKILLVTLLIFILSACKKSNNKSPELIQAYEMHLESMRIHENMETELIEKKQNAINNKDVSAITKLDSLSTILELWEEGIIEVPGFEHEHHHEKGEHHEHKTEIQMTDESMFEYQKKSQQAIEELQKEINNQFK
ncbi:MAG: hypothetical protein ABIN24_15835 [Dyadobacter sp.]